MPSLAPQASINIAAGRNQVTITSTAQYPSPTEFKFVFNSPQPGEHTGVIVGLGISIVQPLNPAFASTLYNIGNVSFDYQ
jgi:hypothetical protein